MISSSAENRYKYGKYRGKVLSFTEIQRRIRQSEQSTGEFKTPSRELEKQKGFIKI